MKFSWTVDQSNFNLKQKLISFSICPCIRKGETRPGKDYLRSRTRELFNLAIRLDFKLQLYSTPIGDSKPCVQRERLDDFAIVVEFNHSTVELTILGARDEIVRTAR